MSLRAWSRSRGIPLSTAALAMRTGRITRRPDGLIEPAVADAQWRERTRTRVDSRTPGGDNGDLHGVSGWARARTAREALTARILELEYRQRVGELVEATEMRDAAHKAGRLVQDRLLAMQARLVPELTMKPAAEVNRILGAEVRAVLDDLATVLDEPVRPQRRRRAS